MTKTEKALYQQVQQLTEERDALAAKCEQLTQAHALLMEQVKQLLRERFGRKSERFEDADNPQQWLFDTPITQEQELPGDQASRVVSIKGYRRRKKRTLRFPSSLPRRDLIIAVDDEALRCRCGGKKTVINHACHERLHYQPPVYEVIVEKREIAACPKGCKGQIVTAPRPPHILPKSKLGESLLAHLIVSKLEDRQPFYHLERQLHNRAGVTLSRQTMARATIDCAPALQPLVNLLKDQVIESDVAALDATGLQVLKEPGRPATVRSLTYCIRGGPPGREVVLYDYNAHLHKQFVDRWFEGFSGTVHCDADPFFERLFAREAVTPSYCNAHARRKFEPVAKASRTPGLAHEAMGYYRELYRIERLAKDQQMTPAERWALRQQYSRPLMDQFKNWLDDQYPTVVPKSTLGRAFHYTRSYWQGLCAFLDDGRLEADNNLTEQQIKPFVLARKNFLFADTVAGAQALCLHFSLIRTAKAHGLEPFRYYEALLTRVPHCRCLEDYEALLPWHIELPGVLPTRQAA